MILNTIAVLPFVNMSSDVENEYFSDGITEEIINALARIDGLKVTSRTSSFYFKNKNVPIKEIAEELAVAIILEGSVRRSGNTVRISAQLIQAEDDYHFWSETWDRKLENIFEIQDEISLLIADKLREHFGHFEIQEHLVEKQTESFDAYDFAMKAKYYFNKWNPEDIRIAIGLYEKALELDPNHTESYVGLADAYGFMATTEFMPREEAWGKAANFSKKAYSLNPENAGVHYQLANLSLFTELNFAEAMTHTLKSIELKPNYPEAQQFMAFLYAIADELENAEVHINRALSIDPLSQETIFFNAFYNYRKGNFGKALRLTDVCLQHNPKNIPAYILKCYCFLTMHKYETVIDFIQKMPNEIVVSGDRLGILCLANIRNKDTEKAIQYLNELKQEAKEVTAFQAHSYLFMAYANLEKFDDAFNWLSHKLNNKLELFGALILFAIGLKILIEHTLFS